MSLEKLSFVILLLSPRLTCSFGVIVSVLELVDAAIPVEHLMPIRETILKVEGVKVCTRPFLLI